MEMTHTLEPILILTVSVAIIATMSVVGVFCLLWWGRKNPIKSKYSHDELIRRCINCAVHHNRMTEHQGIAASNYLDALVAGKTTRGNGNANVEELLSVAIKCGLEAWVITAGQGLKLSAYLDKLENQ